MILSGTIPLSPTDHAATTAELRARLDELHATLAELAACQRDLVGIAAEIGPVLSYDAWRGGCADMVTALAGLRAVVNEVSA